MNKKITIIGSGFSSLSAACFLAQKGYEVDVFEQHNMAGGRARTMQQQGFTFDMGPSWYWMPDVFEKFFNQFGKTTDNYYQLKRLNPSYKIYTQQNDLDIDADLQGLKQLFESLEPGAGKALDKFLQEAEYKYKVGINKLVYKPGKSITEFLDKEVVTGVLKLQVFTDIKKHIASFFKNPQLQQILEFPVLFLGALPQQTPALYSLMNYADIVGGTWYPMGGMYKVIEAMHSLACSLGVKFYFNHQVKGFDWHNNQITAVKLQHNNQQLTMPTNVVVSGADYHFTETQLLPSTLQSYNNKYWATRTMAPSCLIFYVGVNKKIKNLQHHSLFFDADFGLHGQEIYTTKQWPTLPLFYVCAASVTDATVAPENNENLFFLIPIAAGLQGETEELKEKYFTQIVERFEQKLGENITNHIVFKQSYCVSNFTQDYNAFKGNAYGLANTLMQTSILKPKMKSKKVANLFYTGQLTVPGPGVPPAIISGEVVANEVHKMLQAIPSA